MIFIRKIPNVIPNSEWGICQSCSHKTWETLCKECLVRRDSYQEAAFQRNRRSWEYRFRVWLAELIDPRIYRLRKKKR